MTRILCTLEDLDQTEAKEIVFDDKGERVSIFVVKYEGAIRGYVNSCPHARLPLNWRCPPASDWPINKAITS